MVQKLVLYLQSHFVGPGDSWDRLIYNYIYKNRD